MGRVIPSHLLLGVFMLEDIIAWVHVVQQRPSTWAVVVSVCLTAFAALPTFPSVVVHILNVGVLAMVVWLAHHEGRKAGKND